MTARPLPSSQPVTTRRTREQYLPLLLDRLLDDEPTKQSEAPEAYAVSRSQFRERVLRDLSYLLNTTNIEDLLDRARHEAVTSSTLNYGVPALAGNYLSQTKWERLETLIRRAIRDFEPRLIQHTLTIRPLFRDDVHTHYNVLHFEISGEIAMQPYPLAFTVQSAMDFENSRISLRA